MADRVFNFSPGPCTLPLPALEQAHAEFLDFKGSGMSLIEMSHRSDTYEAVHNDALEAAASLFGVPDSFETLFLQGGATLQFAMVPMNLLGPGQLAGYVNSGAWASRAIADARFHGDLYEAWSGAESDYRRMPAADELEVREGTRYVHCTSNETIGGIQLAEWPDAGVPLVVDMSSDFMSRPVPWDRFDLVYGGAQKNMGPAGLTVVFVRRDVLSRTTKNLGGYLRYEVHAQKRSLFNTAPVFSIYMMGKVLAWMSAEGGLPEMERRARTRASLIYDAIDRSDGFYSSPVERSSRSKMNIVFRLPSEDQEKRFVDEAGARGMVSLRGHRAVGGIRASVYNAMPQEGAETLAAFMDEFKQ